MLLPGAEIFQTDELADRRGELGGFISDAIHVLLVIRAPQGCVVVVEEFDSGLGVIRQICPLVYIIRDSPPDRKPRYNDELTGKGDVSNKE